MDNSREAIASEEFIHSHTASAVENDLLRFAAPFLPLLTPGCNTVHECSDDRLTAPLPGVGSKPEQTVNDK